MSWLDPLLAIKTQQAGTTAGTRQTINFASGATVTDDPANDRVNVAITGAGITQLTGDVTAGPGSGSVAATVAKVNGVSVSGTPTSGQVIRATSGTASSWANVARGDITNTSGAVGDLITGDATTLGRLAIGSTGQVLTVSGGAPVWAAPSGAIPFNSSIDDASVSLLLHGDGANGSTTFVDSSFQPNTVVGANGIAISTAQSKFGGSSILFNRASNQYLTIENQDKFTFGTGDFTVEAWIYLNSMPTGNAYSTAFWIVGWGLTYGNDGFDFYIGTTNIYFSPFFFSSILISCPHGFTTGSWYHVALVRNSGVVNLYINGTSSASAPYAGSVYTPTINGIAISAAEPLGATLGNFDGYMDDLRICKGVAKYTANFTPPTSALPNGYSPNLLPSSPSAGQLASSGSALYVCTDATGPAWRRVLY